MGAERLGKGFHYSMLACAAVEFKRLFARLEFKLVFETAMKEFCEREKKISASVKHHVTNT